MFCWLLSYRNIISKPLIIIIELRNSLKRSSKNGKTAWTILQKIYVWPRKKYWKKRIEKLLRISYLFTEWIEASILWNSRIHHWLKFERFEHIFNTDNVIDRIKNLWYYEYIDSIIIILACFALLNYQLLLLTFKNL